MTQSMITCRMIEAARSQIGVPFQHQGRLPKSLSTRGALDCLGLLMVVA